MLLPLLRLLCVSLCSEAVLSHSSHDGQRKTKSTFTPSDYESTATNRNVHKARSGSETSWRSAAVAAPREDRGVVNSNNARAQHHPRHHDATLNSVARRGASRAVRKTQHPKKGPRGRAEDGDGGEHGPWRARGEASAAAMATHGRRGCSHGKSDVNYPIKNKKREQMCRRKKTASSRQRRDVKHGQGDGGTSHATSLAMWESLPKPLAQEQGMDFPFNESSDYEQFTLPNIFDFIPKITNKRKHVRNPFYPVTAESYGAYALVIFAGIIFIVGILGNIAIMCIVCHNYYMRSISNSLLANLAFWDFVVVFFCLPLVTFHELTKNWLLGEFSCKVIPYLEVVSLGVTTFTLCALCIDRFRAATNVQLYYEMIENCCSTGAKLAVIWVGALLLALPEILIRQLVVEDGEPRDGVAAPCERCVVRISTELPDTLYVLGLTYDGARLWWYFGCYFCLPTLFTICCSLVTARKIRRAERAAVRGTKKQIHLESQMNCTVVALAILYGFCIIPENICNIVSVYMAASVPRRALDILHLVSQLLLFCKSAVTPVLLLCLCQPFSRAFLDCCCCCCAECATTGPSGRTSTTATASDNECTTTELELSPFSTIRREVSPYASVGTHC